MLACSCRIKDHFCDGERRKLGNAPGRTGQPLLPVPLGRLHNPAIEESTGHPLLAGEAEAVPADWPLRAVFKMSTLAWQQPSCLVISTGPSFPQLTCFLHYRDKSALGARRSSEPCNLRLAVNETQGKGPAHQPHTPKWSPAWISAGYIFQASFVFYKFCYGGWMPAKRDRNMTGSLNP